MQELVDLLDRTYSARPEMDRFNRDVVLSFLRLGDEVDETQDELNKFTRGESSVEEVSRELADMLILVLSCFRALAQNPIGYVKEKITKITRKYPEDLFSGCMPYDEAIKVAQLRWARIPH